jgi:hypothetical protein
MSSKILGRLPNHFPVSLELKKVAAKDFHVYYFVLIYEKY